MSRLTLRELKDKITWKIIVIDDIQTLSWTNFTDLWDTPVDYTWQAWKVVAVKTTEDWVEFIDIQIWWWIWITPITKYDWELIEWIFDEVQVPNNVTISSIKATLENLPDWNTAWTDDITTLAIEYTTDWWTT